MNQINRNRVEEFLSEHNTDPLIFEGYESIKEEFDPSKYSVESMVHRALYLSQDYDSVNSVDEDEFESRRGKWRSSLDIWRHIKYYYPDITIYDVMHALYNIKNECGGQFCNDIERRTFKSKKHPSGKSDWENYQDVTTPINGDEYKLQWEDWKDI